MRKKKSYMNNENILKEGFFDKLKKMLGLSTKQLKIIKKHKEASNIVKDLNKQVDKLQYVMNRELEKMGIDDPITLTKYTLKDFD